MLTRLLAAICGAVIITAGLFLLMETLTSLWRNQDRERVFRIDDILSKPEPDRPARPQSRDPLPEVPGADLDLPTDAPPPVVPDSNAPAISLPPPDQPSLTRPGTVAPAD